MGCPNIALTAQPGGEVALTGRDREIRIAAELLDGVCPGRLSVLVVEGPPGAGRSRFLREVAADAQRRGMTVVPEPRWVSAVGDRRALSRWRGTPSPLLFLSDRPLRIEARTWDALDVLAESVPVLVAVSAAPGAGPVPAERLSSPVIRRLPLTPLDRADMARLAGAVLGLPPGPELAGLLAVAAGRPGLLRDLLAGLREEGLVRPAFGKAVLTSPRLPRRTETWVRGQLAALSPAARHLVQAAAALPAPFPLVQLTRLLDVSPVAVVPAVEEALASGLVTGDGDLLSLTHDGVRAIVTAGLPRPVAAALRAEPPVPAEPQRPAPPDSAAPPRLRARAAAVLSERERQIATLVGRALTNRQIARRVGISPHTVNYHLRQIFQKLGIASRVELAARWQERPGGGPSSS